MGKTVRVKASELRPLTKKDIKRMKDASKRPIIYDEDSPKTTKEQLSQFRRRHEQNRINNRKVVFSTRITKNSYDKLKSFGPGYSSIVANMIEYCLKDPEIIKKCL